MAGGSEEPTEERSLRERVDAVKERARDLQERAQTRFEHERSHRSWVATTWDAWVRMSRRGGPLLSGGLAYRLFLFMLPAALFVVSLAGLVGEASGSDIGEVARDAGMGAALATAIGKAVAQTDASRWSLMLLGLVLTVWAGRSAASAFILVSRIAWSELRPARVVSSWRAGLVFTGAMLAASIFGTIRGDLVGEGVIRSVIGFVLLTIADVTVIVLLMIPLPRAGRPWPVVLPGAVFFGLVIRGMIAATDLYFAGKLDRASDLYGALGIAIVMLLWLYLVAWGWVAGQFLNAGFAGIRDTEPVEPGAGGTSEPPSLGT